MLVTQINPKDAFKILVEDKNSVLVDVRTFEEFAFVGTVDPTLFGGRMILSPWKLTMSMKDNPSFIEDLEAMLERFFGPKSNESKILFLCRSGARSNAAANLVSSMGYAQCFNILGGFEGDLDSENQRGSFSGWKAEKLPWKQS